MRAGMVPFGVVYLVSMSNLGCAVSSFDCQNDEACNTRPQGKCLQALPARSERYCAFAEVTCASGLIWDASAGGGVSNTCVPSAPSLPKVQERPARGAQAGPELTGPDVCSKIQCCPSDMVYVPPGSFYYGAVQGPNAAPQKALLTRGYCIDRTEVSVAAYWRCVEDGKCDAPDIAGDCDYAMNQDSQLPVACLSWQQAQTFCGWSGNQGGSRRLPTSAEWERAARGDLGYAFPWGNWTGGCYNANFAGGGQGNDFCVGVRPYLVEVGSIGAGVSPFGIMEAAGNVREWTADCFSLISSGLCETSPCVDPRAPEWAGCERVVRGGSFDSAAAQVATSLIGHAGHPDRYTGFRCAATVGSRGTP